MKPISQLTHWKICRFWNRHKWLHRAAIVFILAPVCLFLAIPAAVKGAYDNVAHDFYWFKDLWRRSNNPYDKWIKAEESGDREDSPDAP